MTEYRRQRQVPRLRITGRPTTRVRPTLEARLVDLSLTGARIEHLGLLRPGFPCTIELPAAKGSVALSSRIVWSSIVGSDTGPGGERILRYESGLEFTGLTAEQRAALSSFLEQAAHAASGSDGKPSASGGEVPSQ